jgi:hypothetical protein
MLYADAALENKHLSFKNVMFCQDAASSPYANFMQLGSKIGRRLFHDSD